MLDRPNTAPHSWTQGHTEAAVRELVRSVDPDLVLFQELPGLVPFVETHVMVPSNPRSHNGNLATLVRADMVDRKPQARAIPGCALLVTLPDIDITIANVHLAPGKGAANERLTQIARVVEASPTTPLLVVGDTNTRLNEAEQLASLGLGGEKPPSPTWDSRKNRYHEKIPEFSAYFTRWFCGGNVAVTDAKVWNDNPVAFEGSSFFISDHYALSGTVTVSAS